MAFRQAGRGFIGHAGKESEYGVKMALVDGPGKAAL
jgi:hypothetical protein